MKAFEIYYTTLHKGRKLIWSPNASFIKLEREGKVVLANAYQAAILLLFTEHHRAIKESDFRSTILNDIELKMTLQSLVDSNVLCRSKSDLYSVALLESSVIDARKTFAAESSSIDTTTDNSARRGTIIKARIVKVLKQKKQIKHSELLSYLAATITSFAPALSEINRALETLVEKDYIAKVGMVYQYT